MKRIILLLILISSLTLNAQVTKVKGVILDTLTTAELTALPSFLKVKGSLFYNRDIDSYVKWDVNSSDFVSIEGGGGSSDGVITGVSFTSPNLIVNGSGGAFDGSVNLSSLDTNTQLSEAQVDAFVANNGYLTSETDDQTAAEVSVTASGNLSSTDVQAGLEELQTDIDALSAGAADGAITDLTLVGETLEVTGTITAENTNVDLSSFALDSDLATAGTDDQTLSEVLAEENIIDRDIILDSDRVHDLATSGNMFDNVFSEAFRGVIYESASDITGSGTGGNRTSRSSDASGTFWRHSVGGLSETNADFYYLHGSNRYGIGSSAILRLESLAGGGDQMLVVNNDGDVGVQAIPSGGGSQNLNQVLTEGNDANGLDIDNLSSLILQDKGSNNTDKWSFSETSTGAYEGDLSLSEGAFSFHSFPLDGVADQDNHIMRKVEIDAAIAAASGGSGITVQAESGSTLYEVRAGTETYLNGLGAAPANTVVQELCDDCPPASTATASTLELNDYKVYDDRATDATTFDLSNIKQGAAVVVEINRASVFSITGATPTNPTWANGFTADTRQLVTFYSCPSSDVFISFKTIE